MGVLVDIVTSERDPEKEPQGRYRLIEGRHANAARRQMHWPIGVAVGTLLVVTVLVALVSEVFVESVQKAAETFGISPAFVGFIIVSIVGAAAEMAVAFSAARKNRLGMSVSIALGSASQIALFVAPALVLLSYIVGPVPMNLQFWPGAVTMVMISAVMATFITNKLKRRRPRHPVSEHVFEGKPNARQSADVATPVSRFRPRYRALTPDEKALHDAIKQKADELVALFEQVKPGRYPSLGITTLEESEMWTVKELTSRFSRFADVRLARRDDRSPLRPLAIVPCVLGLGNRPLSLVFFPPGLANA